MHRLHESVPIGVCGCPQGRGASSRSARSQQAASGLRHSFERDSGFRFTRENGEPVRPDTFSARFQALALEAGLPHMPLHGLRHSAATFHLTIGTPVAVVFETLGHASTAITMDIYSAVPPRMHREAVERYAAALDGGC